MINHIPNGMLANSLQSSSGELASTGASPGCVDSCADSTDTGKDVFLQAKTDNNPPEKMIPLTISSKNKDSINNLKSHISENFAPHEVEMKENIGIVDGIKVGVERGNIEKLVKSLPEDTIFVFDNLINFQLPTNPDQNAIDLQANDRPAFDITNSTLGISKLWDMGYTGKGIGIMSIDSGVYPHKDFEGRLKTVVDFNTNQEKPIDPFGHGTITTGVAAGSGAASAGKFKGVAPESDIIGARITQVSEAIKALQWAIENKEKYNIRVISMPLGDFPLLPYKDDPWCQAAEKTWDKGIFIAVAAGNEGPGAGTISTPGTDAKIMTVGSMDDKSTPQREDDIMSRFSSRGPTMYDGIQKPDIVATGVGVYGPLAPGSTLDTPSIPHYKNQYISMSGSSMSTPIVAGVAALMIQANPDLTPDDIKKILMETADKYLPNSGQNIDGAGLIDPLEAIQTAIKMKKTPENFVPSNNDQDKMIISKNSSKNSSINNNQNAYVL